MTSQSQPQPHFTPGPWYVLREGSGDLFVEPAIAYWSKFDILAHTAEERDQVWSGKMANAALIAAAPEMYALLSNILNDLETDGSISLNDNAANDIRMLLAKVTGEHQ